MSWGGSFSYSWNPPPPATRVTTSRTELLHIGVAYAVLTFDLLLVISGMTILRGGSAGGLLSISPEIIAAAAGAAATGFVAHEMAHKVVAQRRGFWAEFRVFPMGLMLSLITSAFGWLFAAPGATMVGGIQPSDAPSWGRTSLAGPMTNAAFAAAFYAGAFGTLWWHPAAASWLLFLAFINAWFGAFNLIPFGPLDGRKVLRWSTPVWVVAFAATAAATIITYVALQGPGPTLGL